MTADVSLSAGIVLLVTLVIVGLSVALASDLVVVRRRRRRVISASIALHQLEELNTRFRSLLPIRPPIQLSFETSVTSKARFDRFDLPALMNARILDHERWVEDEIDARLAATGYFDSYRQDFEAIARELLGTSTHPRLRAGRFAAIEQKMYRRRMLAYPTPTAQVTTTVKYTSPKGQNSYSRSLQWDFAELRVGLRSAQLVRAQQSTAGALRQRERNLMTPGLRMKILQRDNRRCQWCGASASDGASLHIDHVTPVSLGGRTTESNLQTLCRSCNIGKSNTFIG